MPKDHIALDLAATDPVAAFSIFADDPMAVLLDSAGQDGDRGRYSYIAALPTDILAVGTDDDPLAPIRLRLDHGHRPTLPGLPPFQGGVAGWLSYDLNRCFERISPPSPTPPAFPCGVMGVFPAVAAFDHQRGRAWVIGDAPAARTLHDRLLAAPKTLPAPDWRDGCLAKAEITAQDYRDRIAQVVGHIHAGDAFQVNLAQRFTADMPPVSPFTLYRRMRQRAPGPFSAFIQGGGMALASVSPERFLTLNALGQVETRPIKGSRPRGQTPDQDRALAQDLVASDKDRAENLMILDLMRNDLGRVCAIGSVRAPQRMALETFPAIHHLVSAVTGQLRPGLAACDLLAACFPPGSISGAPKPMAMEIIARLESGPRGPYCGAFGWMGWDGAMDMAVAIRTLAMTATRAVIHAGGGITALSDPAAEYDETLVKARPILEALAGHELDGMGVGRQGPILTGQ